MYTPIGAVVPLSSIARIEETVDTNIIRRLNGQRTVTLNIIPPDRVALETGLDIVKRDLVNYLRETGAVPGSINMTISGASDQLEATQEALAANYVVAIIIIYLLLVAIFTHWGYPLLVMTTIPLGVAADRDVDAHNRIRSGAAGVPGGRGYRVYRAWGLAPLVFLAGEGTELYRGVGVIVMFGLLGKVAALFGGKQFPVHYAPSLFSETPSSAGSAAGRRAPAARVPSSHPWRPVLQAW